MGTMIMGYINCCLIAPLPVRMDSAWWLLLPLTASSAGNGTFLTPVFIHTVYSQLSFCWQTQVTIYNLYSVTMLDGNLHSKPITVLFLYIRLWAATEMKAAVFIVSGPQRTVSHRSWWYCVGVGWHKITGHALCLNIVKQALYFIHAVC